jgi:tRNA G18 (ribose-2'-O)-methylase SpoU
MRRKRSYDEIFSERPRLEELKSRERLPLYALVENIRSMHNVGSIFRTSDGVCLSRLFLTGYTARPPRKEIDKTALGATDSVPWEFSKDPLPFVRELKKKGVQIIVVEHTTDSVEYTKTSYTFPVCVVLGNEVDGVSEEIVRLADLSVEIPMYGLKQSLNVSVAYGIIIYHLLEQYHNHNVRPGF